MKRISAKQRKARIANCYAAACLLRYWTAAATSMPLPSPLPAGFKPCAPTTHDLVPDLKGLVSIPYDVETDGLKCARFLIFTKGKAVHTPNAHGQYITTAPYDVMQLPCLAHFEGIRKPELCTSIVDFSATNRAIAGVSIETLRLPLKMRHNTYQTLANFVPAADIVGFSPIPPGETTINLEATLKGIDPYKQFVVSKPTDILKLVGEPLEPRLTKLREHAQARIKVKCDEVHKAGDASAASEQLGLWSGKLEAVVQALKAMPPINYDARLTSRVTKLDFAAAGVIRPAWLASPLKEQLIAGAAGVLQRSRLFELPNANFGGAAAAAAAAAAAPGAGAAAAAAAAAIAAADDDGLHAELEEAAARERELEDEEDRLVESDEEEEAPALPAKRKRAVIAPFCPPAATGRGRGRGRTNGRGKAPAPAPAAAAPTAEPPINSRTGKPYQRGGPYKSRDGQQAPKPKLPAPLSMHAAAVKTELDEAKLTITRLEGIISGHEAKLDSARHETRAVMRLELHQQYMLGLQHGSALSRGEPISLTPFAPTSAGSSSHSSL